MRDGRERLSRVGGGSGNEKSEVGGGSWSNGARVEVFRGRFREKNGASSWPTQNGQVSKSAAIVDCIKRSSRRMEGRRVKYRQQDRIG